QKCFKQAAKIWYVSEKLKQALISHKLIGNFEQLYNVVNTTIFSRKEIPKFKKPTFLHVSSLVEREKNLQGTFKALQQLQNKGFDFDVIIAGGNSESIETLKDFQKTIGLNNVTYKGIQNKKSISELMNQSHALLLFSHFEGMPVVALEALACGLPVLASSVGALPQLIQEDFGKLVLKNDVNHIAELIENFLLNKFSFNENKMQAFIKNNASIEVVGKKMFDFYNAC
ncbi:MAG: glycosyltransferase, partial [Bacteroidia bacterium]|nr:glycosyltransferase [Bacteroidia bacterium]